MDNKKKKNQVGKAFTIVLLFVKYLSTLLYALHHLIIINIESSNADTLSLLKDQLVILYKCDDKGLIPIGLKIYGATKTVKYDVFYKINFKIFYRIKKLYDLLSSKLRSHSKNVYFAKHRFYSK